MKNLGRRTFVFGSAAVVGGFALGYYAYKKPYKNPLLEDLEEGEKSLNPYVIVNKDGVTVIAPRAEMGQGVMTTLAALVAEELDVSMEQIKVIHGPASRAYFNEVLLTEAVPFTSLDESSAAKNARSATKIVTKFLGWQITGGSTSVHDAYDKMREAGAAARHMLVAAAAKKWGLNQDLLSTQGGFVTGKLDQKISYQDLAEDAVSVRPPKKVKLKNRSDWNILGTSVQRVDMQEKVDATATYGVDVRVPGMLYATVVQNPFFGGPGKYNPKNALAMRGVKHVVDLGELGIAVVATNTWYAMQAAKSLQVDWPKKKMPQDQAGHEQAVQEAFLQSRDSRNRNDGNVKKALAKPKDKIISGFFRSPYLAHATLEPMNATALWKGNRLDVWLGSQLPTRVKYLGEKITGAKSTNVHVHNVFLGGGFGRRAENDFAEQAIRLAHKLEGTPVKITWSREEDTTRDMYRPLSAAKYEAVLENDRIHALRLELAAPAVAASQASRLGLSIPGPDVTIVMAAWDAPYKIPNFQVNGYRVKQMLPVTSWRSVGASQNGFYLESIIDELAEKAGVDPVEFRLAHIEHDACRKVIEKARDLSGWTTPLAANRFRGFAFCVSFGVPVAQVIEIQKNGDKIKLHKAYIAADVGVALDPRNVKAQLQGGMLFGLSAAIKQKITVHDGRVEQTNFHLFDSLRLKEAPAIEVAILENLPSIRGIGEPGVPPAAPALANAIYRATGKRIRSMPFTDQVEFEV